MYVANHINFYLQNYTIHVDLSPREPVNLCQICKILRILVCKHERVGLQLVINFIFFQTDFKFLLCYLICKY